MYPLIYVQTLNPAINKQLHVVHQGLRTHDQSLVKPGVLCAGEVIPFAAECPVGPKSRCKVIGKCLFMNGMTTVVGTVYSIIYLYMYIVNLHLLIPFQPVTISLGCSFAKRLKDISGLMEWAGGSTLA